METTVDEYGSITLHLNDIHDFFTAPDYDPFDPQSLDVSGIDYVMEYMRGNFPVLIFILSFLVRVLEIF
jgi:hypothetical protein